MKKFWLLILLTALAVSPAFSQQTATQALTLNVVTQLAITTTTAPGGIVNQLYSPFQLQATGGTPPYTWSLATGSSLPAGLALSGAGVLSGTPTAAGSFNFTVQVTDSTKTSVKRSLK